MPVQMSPMLDLESEITPRLTRCPQPAILRAIRNAALEFCKVTTAWRYTCPVVDVKDGVHTYRIPVPAEGVVNRVIEAEFKSSTAATGRPIYPRTEEHLRTYYGGGQDYQNRFTFFYNSSDWKTGTGEPHSFIHQEQPRDIRLVPIPTADALQGLTMYISVKPSMKAETLPTWIIENYYQALAQGAVSNLMAMTDEAWSDPRQAGAERHKFDDMISSAQADVMHSHTKAGQQVQPRWALNA